MLDLLILPLIAALVILAMHAYLGLHVIARGIIFVDLAFAQIAALGATVAFLLGAGHGGPLTFGLSLGFTLLGALLFAFTRRDHPRVPQEAIIGIVYVIAGAAVILLSSFSADGAEHIKETLTGSLIWVDGPTVARMTIVYLAIGAVHYVFRRPFLALSFSPGELERDRLWDILFYATFGIVITFSVAITGVLMVFSTLVIPGVIAFFYTARFRTALFIAWASGTVAVLAGLGISFTWDVTTGPVLVCTFGAVLIVAMALRPLYAARTRGPAATP
ncbi:MAG: metal ABC transporter permease [Longimicrobiales bacterium]